MRSEPSGGGAGRGQAVPRCPRPAAHMPHAVTADSGPPGGSPRPPNGY